MTADTPERRGAVGRVHDHVARALERAGVASSVRMLVAFSGGLDSSVLLDAAVAVHGPQSVVAVHVDHGLVPMSAEWLSHCRARADALGVAFDGIRLTGGPEPAQSVEQWAREGRYRAIRESSARHAAALALTAHHADDQAETLLMRLVRGSGIDGLAGIRADSMIGGLRLLRPLLDLGRADLERYARARSLVWVADPTNADPRFLRNAIRAAVMPSLERTAPGASRRMAQAAAHLSVAADALAIQAREDLASAGVRRPDAEGLDRRRLARLSGPRQIAALRHWLVWRGARPPSISLTNELQRQLLDATAVYGEVVHDGWLYARYRDHISLTPRDAWDAAAVTVDRTVRWQGEPSLAVAGGRLTFGPSVEGVGVDAAWLVGQALVVGRWQSAARVRVRLGGPSRSLKNLGQEHGIPRHVRATLPMVSVGGRILFVAGIGMAADWPRGERNVTLGWHPDGAGDPRRPFVVASS